MEQDIDASPVDSSQGQVQHIPGVAHTALVLGKRRRDEQSDDKVS